MENGETGYGLKVGYGPSFPKEYTGSSWDVKRANNETGKDQYIRFKNIIKEYDNKKNMFILNDFNSKLIVTIKLNKDLILIKCRHDIVFFKHIFR